MSGLRLGLGLGLHVHGGAGDVTAPTITSSASPSVAENATLAHSLTANESVTWAIRTSAQNAASVDYDKFELSGSTLRWAGNGTKDYEAPDDTDSNNTYVVVVRATDAAGNTSDQTITVTVTNVFEEPSYRYWGFRALTTENGVVSCATLSGFETGSSTDRFLQSAGAVASTPMSMNGSFPVTNINDNDNSSYAISAAGQAGADGIYWIDLGSGQSRAITKIGWRARNDAFGPSEAPLTGAIVAKANSGDSPTTIKSIPTQTTWAQGENREFSLYPSLAYANRDFVTTGAGSLVPTYSAMGAPSFALTAGSLPAGLSLNGSTGEISGTATTPGTYGGLQVTLTDDAGSVESAAFTITVYASGYRYVFLEFVSSSNNFLGCSTLKVFDDGLVDRALQSNGGTASAVGYTPHASFPITNINDGNDTSFTTSSGASAGSGKGFMIELGAVYDIPKVGYRSRSDSFGDAEAITSGYVKAKLNADDALTTLYTISESGWGDDEYREWTMP